MLLEVTDHKGKTHYVSAMHVRYVREKKPGVSVIYGPVSAFSQLVVSEDTASLVRRINDALLAMGIGGPMMQAAQDADDDDDNGGNVAMGAAMMG